MLDGLEGLERELADGGVFLGRELAQRVRDDPEARMPPYLWGLARVLGLVSGVAASLGTRLDLVGGVLPHLAPRPAEPRRAG